MFYEFIDFVISIILIKKEFFVLVLKVNIFLGGIDFIKIEFILSNEKEKVVCYFKKEFVFFYKDLYLKEEVI